MVGIEPAVVGNDGFHQHPSQRCLEGQFSLLEGQMVMIRLARGPKRELAVVDDVANDGYILGGGAASPEEGGFCSPSAVGIRLVEDTTAEMPIGFCVILYRVAVFRNNLAFPAVVPVRRAREGVSRKKAPEGPFQTVFEVLPLGGIHSFRSREAIVCCRGGCSCNSCFAGRQRSLLKARSDNGRRGFFRLVEERRKDSHSKQGATASANKKDPGRQN
mmetsp:Transcript_537/g.1186  ORF Transcript_537/g.1186 Transcript_537/m.1186 type:complete len:217 (-) Transcript_537:193-843(-)